LPVEISEEQRFTRYDAEELTILCGDFFDLSINDLRMISAIYDRASLIALPPEIRKRYVQHLMTIVPDNTEILLVTMEYPEEEMNGPPFAVIENEIRGLYADQKRVDLLSEYDVLGGNSRFKERGLTSMIEKVYRISN